MTPAQDLLNRVRAEGGSMIVTVGSTEYNIAEANPSAFIINQDFWDNFATLSINPALVFSGAKVGGSTTPTPSGGTWKDFSPPLIDTSGPPPPQPQPQGINLTTLLVVGLVAVVIMKL